MRWRAAPALWPPLAAVTLSLLAAAQAGARIGGSSAVRPASGPAPIEVVTERPQETVVAVLLALGATAPLGLAGLWPVVAASLSGLAVLLCMLAQITPTVGAVLAFGISCFVVGRTRPVRVTACVVAPFAVYAALPVPRRDVALVVLAVAVIGGAIGASLRLSEETRRRDAVVVAANESTLEHLARGERARIARELHDVVAHHVSLIALQAEAARLTVPGMPPEGEKRLLAIGDTARTALTEMRRLLGVLREDADAADVTTRRPQPGLGQLPELLDDVRDAGPGSARLIVRGTVGPLDQGIEVTAYRVVQEALTNARRHAPGSTVDVEVDYRDDLLVVQVRDNGPGPGTGPDPVGHGLAGMRERVAMAGGTLRTGGGSHGGFVVRAELPTTGAAR